MSVVIAATVDIALFHEKNDRNTGVGKDYSTGIVLPDITLPLASSARSSPGFGVEGDPARIRGLL